MGYWVTLWWWWWGGGRYSNTEVKKMNNKRKGAKNKTITEERIRKIFF